MNSAAPDRQGLIVRNSAGLTTFCDRPFPTVIAQAGPHASRAYIEFFAAQIRNPNTRAAYVRAVSQFFEWCDEKRLRLRDIGPFHVAVYIEELPERAPKLRPFVGKAPNGAQFGTTAQTGPLVAPSVKQHLAAIRMLFNWLVIQQVVPTNPAASVRGPKHVVNRGKTPVLSAGDARKLLDSIPVTKKVRQGGQMFEIPDVLGLRDRALIAAMVYSFARVSATTGMKVQDFYRVGPRYWLRLHEKGGKFHEVPAHHNVEAYMDAYLTATGLTAQPKTPLFRSADQAGRLTAHRLTRTDALRMIKRRALRAGLPASTCCHTFRATGITTYLEGGGTLEKAQAIASHESPRTTKLYDRTNDSLTLDEIERIRI